MKPRPISFALRLIAALLIPVQFATAGQIPLLASVEAGASPATLAPKPAAPSVQLIPAVPPPPAAAKANTAPPPDRAKGVLKKFSAQPADGEFLTLHPLIEPLLPVGGKTTPAENQALARALGEYHQHVHDANAVQSLEGFLQSYPQTPWRTSLQVNLGLIDRSGGYWTKALAAWRDAWNLGQGETEPMRRGVADRALAEEAELLARLGRVDDVAALLDEAGARDVRGPNREKFSNARVSLNLERTEPEKSFRCGPFALGRIWQAQHPGQALPDAVFNSRCTPHGTSLPQVQALGEKIGLNLQAAKRQPGAAVIVPAVAHWKAGHYAAVTAQQGDFYEIQDPTFGIDLHVRAQAFDEEGSGYFLVPAGPLPQGWQAVGATEAGQIWGKGAVSPTTPPPPPGFGPTCKSCNGQGMTVYDMDPSRVNLLLNDTPLWYTPPVGPAVNITANYSARDVPYWSTLPVSNLGPQWNLNVVSYLVVADYTGHYETSTYTEYNAAGDPVTVTEEVWILDTLTENLYGPGGGVLSFFLAAAGGWVSAPEAHSGIVLTYLPGSHWVGTEYVTAPDSYVLSYPDGSSRVYWDYVFGDTTDGALMTQSYDAFGNGLQYGYDSGGRLTSVTDALGQVTTLSYVSDDPGVSFCLVSQVTDPFGRSCGFTYNASGQLAQITDSAGLQSQFTYGAGDFVSTLTTPYGATNFVETDTGNDRQLDITDPEGNTERVLFKYSDAAAVPDMNAPLPAVPGLSVADGTIANNAYWAYRNSYYWDKKAFADAAGNYAAAHLTHWLHTPDGAAMSDIPESEKPALESRIFYSYPGQTLPLEQGTSAMPIAVGRVLDDGVTTQASFASYTTLNKLISSTTPGNAATPVRTTVLSYAANGVDVLAAYQDNPGGASMDPFGRAADLLGSATYNAGHEPLTTTDASGETTVYTYNSYGQIKTVTNAKGETTTFAYSIANGGDDYGYLLSVTGPVAGATTAFTYDGFGRLSTTTDSQGYVVTTEYEAIGGSATETLNRPSKIDYPDGTSQQIFYNRLDPEWICDRAGRWTHLLHDALQHVVATLDPLGRLTQYQWCGCGSLEALIDPNGNQTTWVRDVEKRVTDKIYADDTDVHYTYENTTSRVKSVTDAKGQQTIFAYNIDNSTSGVSFANAAIATPGVSFTYDGVYGRIATMTDGIGLTTYTYNAITTPPTLGAGRLASEASPWANSTIAYTYDELGRALTRSINGAANATSVAYDSLGRVSSTSNLLGTFTPSYVSVTNQLASVDYPNTQRVAYAYFPNAAAAGTGNGDRRLKQIQNLGIGAGGTGSVISEFDYTYDVAERIATWEQMNSGGTDPSQYTFAYDAADQLTSATLQDATTGATLDQQSYAYDAMGNRTLFQENQAPISSGFNSLNQLLSQSAGGSMQLRGVLNEAATLSIAQLTAPGGTVQSTTSAQVDPTTNAFQATVPAAVGSNTYQLTATDASYDTTVKTITVSVPAGTTQAQTYDLNGNTTAAGPAAAPSMTYGWDAQDSLVTITQGSNVTQFDYDGMGRRVRESLNGTEIRHWIWCGMTLSEERAPDNSVTKQYFGFGETRSDGSVYYYTRDHLGSPREVTASNGSLLTRYTYDSWGNRSTSYVSGTVDVDFGFTGHYYHSGSGSLLAPFRAYSAAFGRWLSRDPIRENRGLNLYLYVGDAPINRIDPLGLTWPDTIWMGVLWATGAARHGYDYGPGTNEVNDMMNAPGVQNAIAFYNAKNANLPFGEKKCVIHYAAKFGLSGLWAAGGNSTRQFVGSYNVNIYPNPDGTIKIMLLNTTSMTSALYGAWPNALNPPTGFPMGNTSQFYHWTQADTSGNGGK